MKTRLFYIISLSWIMLVSLQSCGLEEMYGTTDYIKRPVTDGVLYVLFYDMAEELGGNLTDAVPCNPLQIKKSLQGEAGWQVGIYDCTLRNGMVKQIKTETAWNPDSYPGRGGQGSCKLLFDLNDNALYITETYLNNPERAQVDTLLFNYDVSENGIVTFAGLKGKLLKYDESRIIVDAIEDKEYYSGYDIDLKGWRRFVITRN